MRGRERDKHRNRHTNDRINLETVECIHLLVAFIHSQAISLSAGGDITHIDIAPEAVDVWSAAAWLALPAVHTPHLPVILKSSLLPLSVSVSVSSAAGPEGGGGPCLCQAPVSSGIINTDSDVEPKPESEAAATDASLWTCLGVRATHVAWACTQLAAALPPPLPLSREDGEGLALSNASRSVEASSTTASTSTSPVTTIHLPVGSCLPLPWTLPPAELSSSSGSGTRRHAVGDRLRTWLQRYREAVALTGTGTGNDPAAGVAERSGRPLADSALAAGLVFSPTTSLSTSMSMSMSAAASLSLSATSGSRRSDTGAGDASAWLRGSPGVLQA